MRSFVVMTIALFGGGALAAAGTFAALTVGAIVGNAVAFAALDIDNRAWEVTGLTTRQLDLAVDSVEPRMEAVVSALL